ncbi:MAG: helicase C-terminal domain-containing protein [Planctomycetota bacterium]
MPAENTTVPPLRADDVFGAEGLLAKAFRGHEWRPQQREMAEAVERALAGKQHLIAEAGTGVGKSFAYLVPAILHALRTEKPVLVATNTIVLQEQLVGKDIPALQKFMPVKFTAALAKGRGQYLCGPRLRLAVEQPELAFEDDPGPVTGRIAAWFREGGICDRTAAPFAIPEDVWAKVCCDDSCTPASRKEQPCHYHLARKRLLSSQIIVANHALLVIDLKARANGGKLLPDSAAIVIDEAHAFEKVALDQMGLEFRRKPGVRLLAEVLSDRRKTGILQKFEVPHLPARLVGEARERESKFFLELDRWAAAHGRRTESGDPLEVVLRVREPGDWNDAAAKPLEDLGQELRELIPEAKSKEIAEELSRLSKRLDQRADSLRSLLVHDADTVTWVERTGRGGWELRRVPVEAGPTLEKALFVKDRPAILTSATLSTGHGDFDGMRARLGARDVESISVGSPFDFEQQATLIIARAMPSPLQSAEWAAALPSKILKYLRRSDGRALVLFTSFVTMRKVHERVSAEWDRPILVQGSGMTRDKMIAEMKRAPGTVVFGVESFWHGVDVPGEALENVIVTKLPFPNPSEPLTEARHELIKKRGGNAFKELDLPAAILMFRQGFGRLIRTRTDRGIVVVLDSRIASKSYGRRFLDALPPCRVEFDDEP